MPRKAFINGCVEKKRMQLSRELIRETGIARPAQVCWEAEGCPQSSRERSICQGKMNYDPTANS
jgi:hypothetical protein